MTPLPTPEVVTVYGAAWCGDCRRAKRFLEGTDIPFRYVDLEYDAAAQRLIDDAGYRAIPVIVTPTGQVLIEPSDLELATALSPGWRDSPRPGRSAEGRARRPRYTAARRRSLSGPAERGCP